MTNVKFHYDPVKDILRLSQTNFDNTSVATLPVEIDASRRALASLERLGLSDPEQRAGVQKVLTAAAFTYIAAAALERVESEAEIVAR